MSSHVETITDVDNTFLSRREIVCDFIGSGGNLKKLDAVDMIEKKFSLDGKVIVPIKMKNHIGKTIITGTFYVYSDKELAKEHVNPSIMSRLEKAEKAKAEQEAKVEGDSKDAPSDTSSEKSAEGTESKEKEDKQDSTKAEDNNNKQQQPAKEDKKEKSE
jgi:ribosomal protein S24E